MASVSAGSDRVGDRAWNHEDRRGVFIPRWAVVDCDGDARDAMVLAQITWWLQPGQRNGSPRTVQTVVREGRTWLYTTDAELGEQLALSADQIWRARRSLRKRGLIESMARQVRGLKVTLIRPVALLDHPAISRLGAATSRDSGTATSRDSGTATSRDAPSTDRVRQKGSSAERAHRIPDDFAPSPQALDWARQQHPQVDLADETDRFVDYWRGTGKAMVDWSATWRNWIRRSAERLPAPRPGPVRGAARAAPPVLDTDRDGPEGLIQL